ncbi:MAG TPA: anthranilate phosphoribosyltransferase [Terriglobales bacterium]|nr:anthranilate phosphoribosyltransferase [Terriglobales bacterium]
MASATIAAPRMIVEALHQIALHRRALSRDEARQVMAEILAGSATNAQIGALLVALSMRGETVDEIVGFAEAIREVAARLPIRAASALDASGTERDALIDTCGTGGDTSGTFNISTATALVVAGAGVRVAKHGNRSVSSKCGSADVMEALGVRLELSAERLAACLEEVGVVFLYAPAMHAASRHVQAARRELKLRTVFNLLGPLTNPAGASAQIVGVYAQDLVAKVAEALCRLRVSRAMVVHGHDGLDEITISGPTTVAEVRDGKVQAGEISPEQFGIARAPLTSIAGGDAGENAAIIRSILAGDRSPRRDVVLLNSAAALVAAGRAAGIAEALPLATQSIDSGAARHRLEALAEFTRRD